MAEKRLSNYKKFNIGVKILLIGGNMKTISNALIIACLIAFAGAVFYLVAPKYTVKSVKYTSKFATDTKENGLSESEESALVRINSITGCVDRYVSQSMHIAGEINSIETFIPFSEEKRSWIKKMLCNSEI